MAKLPLYAAGVTASFTILLTAAAAEDAALLKQAQEIFQPLPKDLASAEFPITRERIELGQSLFFVPRLTIDSNMSCSSCHQPAFYGTDARPKSIGVQQRPHPRNAPTVLNAGASPIVHWRGDRESLEDQVAKAVTSPITSGQPGEKAVIDRLARLPDYAPLFKAAFPDEPQPMTIQNIAKAISAYERTFTTPSPFDAYLAGNQEAPSPAARAGLAKFINTGCVTCHKGVGVGGGMYQKFGMVEDYWIATGSDPIDKGRADVTKDPADLYVFRVASLRNVAMTPPYFHDGSVATLPEAVKVMARVQLGVTLSDADTHDIVAFLENLTGELPANFATAPVLPSGAVAPTKWGAAEYPDRHGLSTVKRLRASAMIKISTAVILSRVCVVSYQALGDETEVMSLQPFVYQLLWRGRSGETAGMGLGLAVVKDHGGAPRCCRGPKQLGPGCNFYAHLRTSLQIVASVDAPKDLGTARADRRPHCPGSLF
jgi:cytochrome c peroxidase